MITVSDELWYAISGNGFSSVSAHRGEPDRLALIDHVDELVKITCKSQSRNMDGKPRKPTTITVVVIDDRGLIGCRLVNEIQGEVK